MDHILKDTSHIVHTLKGRVIKSSKNRGFSESHSLILHTVLDSNKAIPNALKNYSPKPKKKNT